jgi:hypothetical protein
MYFYSGPPGQNYITGPSFSHWLELQIVPKALLARFGWDQSAADALYRMRFISASAVSTLSIGRMCCKFGRDGW